MSKRFVILIGVAAAGVMALGAQTAAAVPALASQTERFDSRVTIHRDPSFHGRVKSSKHACEVHRKVKLLWYRYAGPRMAVKTLGKDISNNRGKWKIVVKEPRRGRVLAHVDNRGLRGAAGTRFTCAGDGSGWVGPRN